MQKQVVNGVNYQFTLASGRVYVVYCGMLLGAQCKAPVAYVDAATEVTGSWIEVSTSEVEPRALDVMTPTLSADNDHVVSAKVKKLYYLLLSSLELMY